MGSAARLRYATPMTAETRLTIDLDALAANFHTLLVLYFGPFLIDGAFIN